MQHENCNVQDPCSIRIAMSRIHAVSELQCPGFMQYQNCNVQDSCSIRSAMRTAKAGSALQCAWPNEHTLDENIVVQKSVELTSGRVSSRHSGCVVSVVGVVRNIKSKHKHAFCGTPEPLWHPPCDALLSLAFLARPAAAASLLLMPSNGGVCGASGPPALQQQLRAHSQGRGGEGRLWSQRDACIAAAA
eukprot:scaffold7122_cov17-Tisochrysis_lutea.AAC.2